jgi:hypothetical protein
MIEEFVLTADDLNELNETALHIHKMCEDLLYKIQLKKFNNQLQTNETNWMNEHIKRFDATSVHNIE